MCICRVCKSTDIYVYIFMNISSLLTDSHRQHLSVLEWGGWHGACGITWQEKRYCQEGTLGGHYWCSTGRNGNSCEPYAAMLEAEFSDGTLQRVQALSAVWEMSENGNQRCDSSFGFSWILKKKRTKPLCVIWLHSVLNYMLSLTFFFWSLMGQTWGFFKFKSPIK